FTGVAGAGDDGVNACNFGHGRGVVRQVVDFVFGLVCDLLDQDLRCVWALQGDHCNIEGFVVELNIKALGALIECFPHFIGVASIRNNQELGVGKTVGDEVIDDAAVFSDDHGVLSLAVFQGVHVGDQRVGQKRGGIRTVDPNLT